MLEINTYRKNTKNINIDLSGLDSYINYTPYFTVRSTINTSEKIIEKIGTIVNGIAKFIITPADNDIQEKEYAFDITIEKNVSGSISYETDDIFTIELNNTGEVIGKYIVNQNVRY